MFYIAVTCPLGEMEARELRRGNRALGEGRSHIEDGIHTWSDYDLTLDTHAIPPGKTLQKCSQGFARLIRSSPCSGSFAQQSACE